MTADAQGIWSEVLPEVRNGVTGVGVWQALNNTVAVASEGDFFVIGLPPELGDLAGHLRLPQTKTLIERLVGQKLGQSVTLRVIDGITAQDWENAKRRDVEAAKLQEQAMARQRADIQARSNWEVVYEQVSRKYASLANKSMPQVRAKFFDECVSLMVESLKTIPKDDENGERNYARCIERIATYADLPSTFVALRVFEKTA